MVIKVELSRLRQSRLQAVVSETMTRRARMANGSQFVEIPRCQGRRGGGAKANNLAGLVATFKALQSVLSLLQLLL